MKQTPNRLDSYFSISQRGSTVRTEIMAGITSFITIAYVLLLNPQITSDPYFIMGDNALAAQIANGAFIGTCLSAFIGTILYALYARVPYVQATGMGLVAFFSYTVILNMGYTYHQALAIIFISGVVCLILTVCGIRNAMVTAIPDCVKNAMTAGIGLFITIIGLKNAGLVVPNASTLVSLVDFAQWRVPEADTTGLRGALVALIGLVIIGALQAKRVKGNILIGIIASTLIGIPLGVTNISNIDLNIGQKFVDFVDVSFLKMDFAGLFQGGEIVSSLFAIVMLVISFLLVTIFDAVGTLIGAARAAGLTDKDGNAMYMKESMVCDSVAAIAGASCGVSTVATVVECGAGIAAGGRTGLTSLVTSVLFLASLILAPIVTIIPSCATAPALIFVGVLMMGSIKSVDFDNVENALPAFCTIIFMPFTYSIANGVAFGLIVYTLVKLFTGKIKEVKPLCLIIVVIFIVRYAFMTLG